MYEVLFCLEMFQHRYQLVVSMVSGSGESLLLLFLELLWGML